MRLRQNRRRTLKEYMEWLLLGHTVRVNGSDPRTVTQVDIEVDGKLVVHFDGQFTIHTLADALEFELVEGES